MTTRRPGRSTGPLPLKNLNKSSHSNSEDISDPPTPTNRGEGLPSRKKKRILSGEIKQKESHPHHDQSYRRPARGSMALAEAGAHASPVGRERPKPRFTREKTGGEKAAGIMGTSGVGDPALFSARLACAIGGMAS